MTNTATNLQMFETGSSTNFLDAVLAKHGSEPSALIPILQDIQENDRYLSQEAMDQVAHALDLSAATVYGVATFYAQFSLEPKGKYVVKVCDGTACHVRGSLPVYEALHKRVGLANGTFTTTNGRYTVETVSCLGACVLAPVITINDQVYGHLTVDAVNMIIDTLEREGEHDD